MHTLLYGGSFDPVHHGHLILARAAREALQADAVLFVPAHVSPFKTTPGAAAEDRLQMLRLATQGDPHFQVDDCELRRAGKSYTFDTLRELLAQNPGTRYTLLLGQDQLATFHSWHNAQQILAMAEVALVGRPGHSLDTDLAAVEAKLGPPTAARLRAALLPTPLLEISATAIRARVQQQLPISYLVPEVVAAYIAQHHLYR
jgi:nicotinate-nucleotide adenylyltransferase